MDEEAIKRMNNLKLSVQLGYCSDWLGHWNHIDAMCDPEYRSPLFSAPLFSWQAQVAVILAKKGVVLDG